MSAPALPAASVLSALQWRYATKAFDSSKKIPADQWQALEQSLVLAPSSFGLQPWKFVVVTDPAVKAKLREKAWGQGQVTDCSHYVVIATRTEMVPADIERYFTAAYATSGAPAGALDGYKQMMLGFLKTPGLDTKAWSARQGYIALGFLMETAALLGIDTCPMEGIDANAFNEILGLPATGYTTTVTCAVGYRSADDKTAGRPKIRYAAAELVKHV